MFGKLHEQNRPRTSCFHRVYILVRSLTSIKYPLALPEDMEPYWWVGRSFFQLLAGYHCCLSNSDLTVCNSISYFIQFLGILFMLPSPMIESSLMTMSNLMPTSWDDEVFHFLDMPSFFHSFNNIENIMLVTMLGYSYEQESNPIFTEHPFWQRSQWTH